MDKIRILHIQETIASGGVEKTRHLLAQYLDKTKYEQRIICTSAEGPIVSDIEAQGVDIIPIGRFKGITDFRQLRKVLKIIKEYKPDIVHGAVFEGVTMACVCGFISRVPIIIAEETSDPQNRSRKANYLMRFLSSLASKVVAISDGTAEYLYKIGIPQSKVTLINNGVEMPREVNNEEFTVLRASLNIEDGDFIIGTVGRLFNDHKRFTDIIKAIAFIGDKRIKLLIVGDGPDKDLLNEVAVDYNIENSVLFAGFQYDTSPYYELMDVFCIASQREGFGLVAAEAMLHHLPVIASNVGGLRYVVQDKITGLLTPPNNPIQLAEKIKKLFTNNNLRKKMGEKGYERAMKEFTSDIYIKKVDSLYSKLINEKGLEIC